MKKSISLEIAKSIRNPYFYIALFGALIIISLSAVYRIQAYLNLRDISFPHYFENGEMVRNDMFALETSYQSWIGSELTGLASTLFFSLMPIIAVLPYAISFNEERKSGYLRIIIPKTGKMNYFVSKIIAVFISGALVILIPLVINFISVSMFIPSTLPHVNYNYYTYVSFGDVWADTFFSMPTVYVMLYILFDALVGGSTALFAFSISFYSKNKFIITLCPFLIYIGIDYLSKLYATTVQGVPLDFSLISLSRAAHGGGRATGWIMALEISMILLFSLFTILFRGTQDDIY